MAKWWKPNPDNPNRPSNTNTSCFCPNCQGKFISTESYRRHLGRQKKGSNNNGLSQSERDQHQRNYDLMNKKRKVVLRESGETVTFSESSKKRLQKISGLAHDDDDDDDDDVMQGSPSKMTSKEFQARVKKSRAKPKRIYVPRPKTKPRYKPVKVYSQRIPASQRSRIRLAPGIPEYQTLTNNVLTKKSGLRKAGLTSFALLRNLEVNQTKDLKGFLGQRRIEARERERLVLERNQEFRRTMEKVLEEVGVLGIFGKEENERADEQQEDEEMQDEDEDEDEEGCFKIKIGRSISPKKNVTTKGRINSIKIERSQVEIQSQNPRHLDPTVYPPALSYWPLFPDQVSTPEWSLGENLVSIAEKEWRRNDRMQLREQVRAKKIKREALKFGDFSKEEEEEKVKDVGMIEEEEVEGSDLESELDSDKKGKESNLDRGLLNRSYSPSSSFGNARRSTSISTSVSVADSNVRRSGRTRNSRHSSLAPSVIHGELPEGEDFPLEDEDSDGSDDPEIYRPEEEEEEGPKTKNLPSTSAFKRRSTSASSSNKRSKESLLRKGKAVDKGKKRARELSVQEESEDEIEKKNSDWEELDEELELPKGLLEPIIASTHSKLDSILILLSKQTSDYIPDLQAQVNSQRSKIGKEKGKSEEKDGRVESGEDDSESEEDLDKSDEENCGEDDERQETEELGISSESDASRSSFSGRKTRKKRKGTSRLQPGRRRFRHFYEFTLKNKKEEWELNNISKEVFSQLIKNAWAAKTPEEKDDFEALESDAPLEDHEAEEIEEESQSETSVFSARPSKPISAFERFQADTKAEFPEIDHPTLDFTQMWSELEESERQAYHTLNAEEWERYDEEVEAWLARDGPTKERERYERRLEQLEKRKLERMRKLDRPSRPIDGFSRYLLERGKDNETLPGGSRLDEESLIEDCKKKWNKFSESKKERFGSSTAETEAEYLYQLNQWRRKWSFSKLVPPKKRLAYRTDKPPSLTQARDPSSGRMVKRNKQGSGGDEEETEESKKSRATALSQWESGFFSEMAQADQEQDAKETWLKVKEEERSGFKNVAKAAIMRLVNDDYYKFKEIDPFPRSKPTMKADQPQLLFQKAVVDEFEERFNWSKIFKLLGKNRASCGYTPKKIATKMWGELDERYKNPFRIARAMREKVYEIELENWERYHGDFGNEFEKKKYGKPPKNKVWKDENEAGDHGISSEKKGKKEASTSKAVSSNTSEKNVEVEGEGWEGEREDPNLQAQASKPQVDRKLDWKDLVKIISRIQNLDQTKMGIGSSSTFNFPSNSSTSTNSDSVEKSAFLKTMERLETLYGKDEIIDKSRSRLEQIAEMEELRRKIAAQNDVKIFDDRSYFAEESEEEDEDGDEGEGRGNEMDED